jgi:hypothetical protein
LSAPRASRRPESLQAIEFTGLCRPGTDPADRQGEEPSCLSFHLSAVHRHTPAGNWLFGMAPVGAEVWLVALALAVLMGGMEEACKAWLRAVPDR